MTLVAIGLGSNVGDRLAHLQAAVDALQEAPDVQILRVSSVYDTDPLYVLDQDPFFNAALLLNTTLGPLSILQQLKKIEASIGRKPSQRYGPREIDLDLLAYGSLQYTFADKLVVPHPLTVERQFVLIPLYEICPELNLPGLGPVSEFVRPSGSPAEVRKTCHALRLH